MKTRDKIVYAALDLFNSDGERNVTTNHIAAHIEISQAISTIISETNKRSFVRFLPSIRKSLLSASLRYKVSKRA